MLEPLLASTNCERVLIFLAVREEGYLREIADFYQSAPAPILKQLEKLENGGVLFSRLAGRTRLYGFNPRYPFLNELKALLDKALTFYPVPGSWKAGAGQLAAFEFKYVALGIPGGTVTQPSPRGSGTAVYQIPVGDR